MSFEDQLRQTVRAAVADAVAEIDAPREWLTRRRARRAQWREQVTVERAHFLVASRCDLPAQHLVGRRPVRTSASAQLALRWRDLLRPGRESPGGPSAATTTQRCRCWRAVLRPLTSSARQDAPAPSATSIRDRRAAHRSFVARSMTPEGEHGPHGTSSPRHLRRGLSSGHAKPVPAASASAPRSAPVLTSPRRSTTDRGKGLAQTTCSSEIVSVVAVEIIGHRDTGPPVQKAMKIGCNGPLKVSTST